MEDNWCLLYVGGTAINYRSDHHQSSILSHDYLIWLPLTIALYGN